MDNKIDSIILKDRKQTPKWLERIVGPNYLNDLRHIAMEMLHCKIENILEESCFYYCSGSDITPIIAFEGFVHSFIYSDNCIFQNYDEGLSSLKAKLRINEYMEIQKTNIDLEFLNIHKSDLALIKLTENKRIMKPIPHGELSIWRKENDIFSLLYLCWDDICVWKNLFERKRIYPTVICAWQPENNNMSDNVWNESNLPQYLLGHSIHIRTDLYKEIGNVEYVGENSVGASVSIPLYEKRANR